MHILLLLLPVKFLVWRCSAFLLLGNFKLYYLGKNYARGWGERHYWVAQGFSCVRIFIVLTKHKDTDLKGFFWLSFMASAPGFWAPLLLSLWWNKEHKHGKAAHLKLARKQKKKKGRKGDMPSRACLQWTPSDGPRILKVPPCPCHSQAGSHSFSLWHWGCI